MEMDTASNRAVSRIKLIRAEEHAAAEAVQQLEVWLHAKLEAAISYSSRRICSHCIPLTDICQR